MKHTLIFVALLLAALVPSPRAFAEGASPFTRLFLTDYGSLAGNEEMVARYDVIIVNRNAWKQSDGNSWKALKKLNPKIEIYLYQLGMEVNDNYDSLPIENLNNLGRWDLRREVPGDNVNQDHPEFFLKDAAGNRINNPGYPHSWLMDIGLPAYQDYWLQATVHDIAQQRWVADGVFLDNCLTLPQYGKPAKYPSNEAWIDAMHRFINATTVGLHAAGQKTCCNRGYSRDKAGYDAFVALDRSANPPDIVYEEGVFAVQWGKSDVQFYREEDWRRQVDVLGAVHHSKVAFQSHCKLAPDQSGTDNFGRPFSFYDALWYAFCSFQLGKNEADQNSCFCFTRGTYQLSAAKMPWYDELDDRKLNLGPAVGPYQLQQVASQHVYVREFAKGYVYVNPTKDDLAAIPMKEKCRRLDHDNFQRDPTTIADVDTIDLAANRGTIMLKAMATHATSPRKP